MAGRKRHSAEDIVRKLRRADGLAAEGKTGEDVLTFEPRVAFDYGVTGVARRQHTENVLHREPPAPNDWLAGKNGRIDCAREE